MRGDHSAPRISYLEGEVEIMSPSRNHEIIKSALDACSRHGVPIAASSPKRSAVDDEEESETAGSGARRVLHLRHGRSGAATPRHPGRMDARRHRQAGDL